jgi:formylglycine-generating enzyme required for sulfatase activity
VPERAERSEHAWASEASKYRLWRSKNFLKKQVFYFLEKGVSTEGSNRVNRGGSWNNDATNCAVSNRNNDTPSNRNNNLGFRLVVLP